MNVKKAKINITVEDITQLRSVLRRSPRDLLLFELATQTGLYAKDLLQLKVTDLDGVKSGQELKLNQTHRSTGRPIMTNSIRRAFTAHIRKSDLAGSDYLFLSRKGHYPLTLISLSRLVSIWFKNANLPYLHGILDLRRIWDHHYHADKPKMGAASGPRKLLELKKFQSISLRDAIFSEMQHNIVCGRIMPGQRIFLENISRQMGVSVIPVREAFAMLTACGFVKLDKKRGYIVNELSAPNFREILDLRLLLECKAAEQAALHRSDEDLSWIEECQRRYITARTENDVEALVRTNRNFHNAIYDAADMPILKSHIDQAWYRVSPYYHLFFRQIEKPVPIVGIQNHQKIIEAIRNKNTKEVRRYIKKDLTTNSKFVIEIINNQQKDG
jgi:GntR family transcriptional regulator, colanic acid and biofilm gene transcriptional regulator